VAVSGHGSGSRIRRRLALPTTVCYICKVLVGARTPYLEPNPTTGTGDTTRVSHRTRTGAAT
jgi:hypothetical protein